MTESLEHRDVVAEVGDISALQSALISAGADVVANPADGLLGLPGYDAGTEANSEIRESNGGSGISIGAEGFVTVHRGVLGDTDGSGGASDIDSRVHRW